MKFNKMTKKFFLGILCFITVGASATAISLADKKVSAETLVLDLFETNKMSIALDAENDGERGVLLSGQIVGSKTEFSSALSGAFSMRYAFPKQDAAKTMKVTFVDEISTKSFSVYIENHKDEQNVSVELNGERAGLYYYAGSFYGLTAGYNREGLYTLINDGLNELSFDTKSMTVSCGGKKVWDFSQLVNDGKELDETLHGFNSYRVCVELVELGEGKGNNFFVQSVNGYSLEGSVIQESNGATISADVEFDALVGQAYTIPQAYAFDILDGVIPSEEIKVAVYDALQNKIVDEKYHGNLSFIPESVGEYRLVYEVENSSKQTKSSVYTISVKKRATTEIDYAVALPKQEMGLGGVVILPSAKATSSLSVYGEELDVEVYVSKDGQTIEGFDGISANEAVCFSSETVGEYTITYKVASEYVAFEESFPLVYSLETVSYQDYALPKVAVEGETLNACDMTFTYGEESKSVTPTVQFPSGAVYSGESFELEETGFYKVIYTAQFQNRTFETVKTVEVKAKGTELFVCEDLNAEYAEYALNNEYKGVLIKQKPHQTVQYGKVINLSDNTKDQPFIDLIVQPSKIGFSDFSIMEIRLTDIYNPDNYILMTLEDSTTVNGKGAITYMRIGAAGQKPSAIGREYFVTRVGKWTGYEAYHSFSGSLYEEAAPDVPLQSLKICMDYANRAIYSKNTYDNYYINRRAAVGLDRHIVTDLDNPDYYSTIWGGFTTGECYLTINVKGVTSESANYLIRSIDGNDLYEDSLNDKTAPVLDVDVDENVPVGLVGAPYKLFDAVAYDKGSVVNCDTRVYYNRFDDGGGEIDVTNGYFVPQVEGDYTIVYTATDRSGNKTTYEVTVNVMNSIQPLSIVLDGLGDRTKFVGEWAKLDEVTIEGGSGEAKLSWLLTNKTTGETVIAENGAFRPMSAGVYEATVTATDYLAHTVSQTYEINVTINQNAVLESEPVFAPALIEGTKIVLPDIVAYDYNLSAETPVVYDIYVTDANGRVKLGGNRAYTPAIINDGDVAFVEYVVRDTQKVFYSKNIIVRRTKVDNAINLANYFVGENVRFTATENGTEAITSTSGATYAFAKAVLSSSFDFIFKVDALNNHTDGLIVTLQDSQNVDEKVVFRLKQDGDAETSIMEIGGVSLTWYGAFSKETNYSFQIKYNDRSYAVSDASGTVKTNLTKYENGKPFKGFTSQFVYVSVTFGNVSQETKVIMEQISNQPLKQVSGDYIAPQFVLRGEIAGLYNRNSEITVYEAKACDVLSGIRSMTVSVFNEEGDYVTSKDGVLLYEVSADRDYQIVLDTYGTYTIQYAARDNGSSIGKSVEEYYYVTVWEDVPPVLTINGKIPTAGKVGVEIVLPTATAIDEKEGETYVWVMYTDPNNYVLLLNAVEGTALKFKPEKEGVYRITYYTYDANNNYVLQEYKIEVAK